MGVNRLSRCPHSYHGRRIVAILFSLMLTLTSLPLLGGVSAVAAAPQVDWTPVSPSVRFSASMAYDPSTDQLVLFGGSNNGGPSNDTWVWNGNLWAQIATPTSPPARTAASLAYDPASEQLVLFGGSDNSGLLNDTWTWDGTDWTQLSPSTPPPARKNASLAYDAITEQLILFGGTVGSGYLGDTWSWNGTDWTQLTPLASPPARGFASMAYDAAAEQLILFGGDSSQGTLNDTWCWNGTNWVQLTPTTSPAARTDASMAYDVATEQIVLFGGLVSSGTVSETWTWDGSNWSPGSAVVSPTDRHLATMAYDAAAEKMVLFGGANGSGSLGDTWVWDGSIWRSTTPPAREYASMAYDAATEQVVLFGGRDVYGDDFGDTWAWDENGWTDVSPVSPAASPPAREYASMAYDAATEKIVLFGGYSSNGYLDDTWEWDGSSWTDVTPASPAISPPTREYASMAYDASTEKVILFGGQHSSTDLDDTWAWDGSSWTQLSPATSPPARYSASMTHDASTGYVVLFGGLSAGGRLGDTWTWNGTTWAVINSGSPATSPAARFGASMTYDAVLEQNILFGGAGMTGDLGDTWGLEGSSWAELTLAHNPPPRDGASMVYDASTKQIVLFGGTDINGDFGDTWLLGVTDHTPPTTTASAKTDPGNASYTFDTWTNQSVQVTLSPVDDTDGSGVADTYYTIGSGTQQTYSAPFTVSGDGDHSITFWSVDNATNAETPQTVHVKIDTVAPTVTYSGNTGSYTLDQTVAITCTASDALSGLASTTCADISGPASSFPAGINSFSASATDNAGNSGSGNVSFTIDVTPDGLCHLTTQLESNRRAERQLCSPLRLIKFMGGQNSRIKPAMVNMYIMLVSLQRDLTPQEKAQLIAYARTL